MLYIYGTVYNNKGTVMSSIDSLNNIHIPKQFLIVDNYSTDGTYEVLDKIKDKYNIILKREKCNRGTGRQLAMELSYSTATDNDLFMLFDLDTTYTPLFTNLIENSIITLKKNEIFINNLCYKNTNFNIAWKNLNNGEDWERIANFIHSGYIYLTADAKYYELGINYSGKHRERRYAHGIGYYKRVIKNQIDLFRGWNIANYKNLKSYMAYSKDKKWHIIPLLVILTYIRISGKTYQYSKNINILYAKENMKIIKF